MTAVIAATISGARTTDAATRATTVAAAATATPVMTAVIAATISGARTTDAATRATTVAAAATATPVMTAVIAATISGARTTDAATRATTVAAAATATPVMTAVIAATISGARTTDAAERTERNDRCAYRACDSDDRRQAIGRGLADRCSTHLVFDLRVGTDQLPKPLLCWTSDDGEEIATGSGWPVTPSTGMGVTDSLRLCLSPLGCPSPSVASRVHSLPRRSEHRSRRPDC